MHRLPLAILLSLFTLLCSSWHSPEEIRDKIREMSQRADSADPEGMYNMATIYEHGFDTIPRDSLRAMHLYRQAAEKGWLPAQNYLGYKLIREGNSREGLIWLERAAMAGDITAQSNLGFLLLDSEVNPSAPASEIIADNEKAAFWLERASAAGSAPAASMLGDLFRYGKGVPQDSLQAAAHYYAAIDAGLADAAYKLEDMERQRWKAMPTEEQMKVALYLYTHRAPDLGVDIFRRIADDNSKWSPVALALLGDAYTRAAGVGYDHDRSLKYYWEAAERGYAPAQFVISELLEIFPDALNPLTLNPPTAQELRQAAAKGGVRSAEEATQQLMNPFTDDQ